jgi:hydrogenase maturation protein HypF
MESATLGLPETPLASAGVRLRLRIRGSVQGVGFRPFVYRLATEMNLRGWVSNDASGVTIEVDGAPEELELFRERMLREKPAISAIDSMTAESLPLAGFGRFDIRASSSGEKNVTVLPDLATCPECRAEILDPAARRYGYPFTNCTNCGPRYTIVESIPYDRPNTSMKAFGMCNACRAEYENPLDRRFHAQPIACPLCGPQVELWDACGKVMTRAERVIGAAVAALRLGLVVAVKGLGGFHLMVNAADDVAVQKLRTRKGREEKPFALMAPSVDWVAHLCSFSHDEQALMESAAAPIVLLRRKSCASGFISDWVAPDNPWLGVMLPYTPLHHLLLAEFGRPVIATSGNRSDEPICTDEREAVERLKGIADVFVVHDRRIVRPVDDSLARIVEGQTVMLRRARGYAPLPVKLPDAKGHLLAVGAHQKNTVAASVDGQAFLSQHIGDLDTVQARQSFEHTIDSLGALYEHQPSTVVCDLHPDYVSSQWAHEQSRPVIAVQHHYAHALSCAAENGLEPPFLAVTWDGSGYGTDGTVWGGEFLRIDDDGFERIGHLRTFQLPGGERAVREPRRVATAVLYECFGDDLIWMPPLPPLKSFSHQELSVLVQMIVGDVHCPLTSSAGRLFDAVSSILGLCHEASFEGQAAMLLEFAITTGGSEPAPYPYTIGSETPAVIDWRMLIRAIVADLGRGTRVGVIARRFHETLVDITARMARGAAEQHVVLSGGCFQNAYLLERTIIRLRQEGFTPVFHRSVPTNDGGIALGQLAAATRHLRSSNDLPHGKEPK